MGSASGSIGSARKQSVPASPDKMAASPRLFMKFQQKKPPVASSSAAEEQQWNVLIDTSGEPNSEADSSARPFDRIGASASASSTSLSSSSSRLPKMEDGWGRSQNLVNLRIGNRDSDRCPDSTVTASGPHNFSPVPLERTATEPFTPCGLGPLGHSDNEDEVNEVFPNPTISIVSSANNTSNTFSNPVFCSSSSIPIENKHLSSSSSSSSSAAAPSSSSSAPSSQQHHHPLYHNLPSQQSSSSVAPTGSSSNAYQSSRHLSRLPTNLVQSTPNSNLSSSESSGVTSTSSSSSHRSGASACQFPMISSSSTASPLSAAAVSLSMPVSSTVSIASSHPYQQSSSMPSSLSTPSSSTPSHLDNRPNLSFTTYASRAKAGGSIVTGLSDRALAASNIAGGVQLLSVSSAPTSTLQMSHSGSSPRRDSVRMPPLPLRVDELSSASLVKSDTSSCDSPLQVDMDDSNHATSDQGSRPSTPKVPPLKIIMPTKASVPCSDYDSKPQQKPALPYVLNPTQEGENWVEGEDGTVNPVISMASDTDRDSMEAAKQASSASLFPTTGSMINTVANMNEGAGSREVAARNLDLDESDSRGSDSRNEQGDNLEDKSEDGKEKRSTRTLRSHTAMMQQQQQSTKTEKNGKFSFDRPVNIILSA